MKLWLLKRPVDKPGHQIWDAYSGFVVRAETEEDARKLANKESQKPDRGYEGPIWEDHQKTSCKQLIDEGEPGVILDDFMAG
jgi:hypothetical protein